MNYKIDTKRIIDGNLRVSGWVLPKKLDSNFDVNVYLGNNLISDVQFARCLREDVAEIYLKEYNGNAYFGFSIEFRVDEKFENTYKIVISSKNDKVVLKINKEDVIKFNSFSHKNKELILSYLNITTFKRAFAFLFKEGISSFIKKSIKKFKGLHVDYDYSEWYELTKPSDEELSMQKKYKFEYNPFYSIVIPVYDTQTDFLKCLFNSLFNQTYKNFEICIVDSTDYGNCLNNPKKFFEKLLNVKADINCNDYNIKNIHVKYINENKSIADNTNEAIEMATGDYIVLCDHDDELTSDALFEVTKAINNNTNAKLLYSDEDKVDTKSKFYFEPAFKPDFNLDMLLSVNYFCHLTTIKRDLLNELKSVDGFYERPQYNGAQDYDLFLRLVNLISEKYSFSDIIHIRKVLYHWRCHKNSTSKVVSSKNYAFENGQKAIADFYKNTSISFPTVRKVENGFDFGIYHTIFELKNEPLVSAIIPNKDHSHDLDVAINSIVKGSYKNIEIIICENNSNDDETFKYYNDILNNKNLNIKVVKYVGEFNYSKINNFAVKYASGEYILLLNNDTEMINQNSIYEMVSYIVRDDVGAVGAKLLYKDKTIQHAGVILGLGGIAGHTFVGESNVEHTYMNRAHLVQDYSAVTAACLMTKKSIFDKIGGFDEKIAVAFNDIDLCIKIRELGKLIVYNPYSLFYHYESKSRGYEDTDEKTKRFNNETAYMFKKWNEKLVTIDEYYNPNLTLRKSDFSLRNLNFEKIGEPFDIPKEIRNIAYTL